MMMNTMDAVRRIGRARLGFAAGVIGLLGLVLGGCSGQNTALLEANRAQNEQITKLVQDNQSLHTLNQQLQDGLVARDQAMSKMQALVNDLRAGRGDLEAKLRDWDTRMAGMNFGNIALDSETDKALAAMAAEHPDLLEYDAKRGLVRFKSDVTFDSGSDKLKDTARSTLHQFAQILNTKAAAYDVRIVGHTDAQPINNARKEHPTNWHLSCHRAISVLKELASNGFAYERAEACGRGEFDPMEPNGAGGKSQKNRRVEVYLNKSYRTMGSMKNEMTPATMTPAKAAPVASPTKGDDFMK
jgi:chemotaxis protein MotB